MDGFIVQASEDWKNMTAEQKQYYNEQSQEDHNRYQTQQDEQQRVAESAGIPTFKKTRGM